MSAPNKYSSPSYSRQQPGIFSPYQYQGTRTTFPSIREVLYCLGLSLYITKNRPTDREADPRQRTTTPTRDFQPTVAVPITVPPAKNPIRQQCSRGLETVSERYRFRQPARNIIWAQSGYHLKASIPSCGTLPAEHSRWHSPSCRSATHTDQASGRDQTSCETVASRELGKDGGWASGKDGIAIG